MDNTKFYLIKRKTTGYSEHASLASLAPVISARGIFQPIHLKVKINQKTIEYRPTDKLVFVTLSMLSGSETISGINYTLRIDKTLLSAFGYSKCAEQSVIQDTLDACKKENVVQMESVLEQLLQQHSLCVEELSQAFRQKKIVTLDIDLSGQPAGKNAEGSSKGYFSKKKNIYGRQLARVTFSSTSEIVTEGLYPGNTHSCTLFKQMVNKMEQVLCLDTKEKRSLIRLRIDAGFGTDANIDYALWRGYEVLTKMFSGNRAKKLAESVKEWVDVPTQKQKENSQKATRQAGWVLSPHRYGRKTRQLAIRIPKKMGEYTYAVLVTTNMEDDMNTILHDYDARSGIPESSFCQDNQGLAQRKRRKKKFVAQQMLTLLCQLAHNLTQWLKNWMIKALEQKARMEEMAEKMLTEIKFVFSETEEDNEILLAIKTIRERGIKRFVNQIFSISGKLVIKKGKIKQLILNPLYPLIERIKIVFSVLLEPLKISVSVGKT
jgi:hypothetical protein